MCLLNLHKRLDKRFHGYRQLPLQQRCHCSRLVGSDFDGCEFKAAAWVAYLVHTGRLRILDLLCTVVRTACIDLCLWLLGIWKQSECSISGLRVTMVEHSRSSVLVTRTKCQAKVNAVWKSTA